MLWDLHVKDLAIINDLQLSFKKGLTVLSGDEGAGKSLLVDALCLLTGGKATTSLIRSGASKAVVEGVFDSKANNSELTVLLEANGIEAESDGTLIITREVHEQGRSIARVNGRAVPVSLLKELGQYLIDIHSQMEHLSLLNTQHQMDLLDRYGGLLPLRDEVGEKVNELRRITSELNLLSGGDSIHDCELLEYQINEIEKANIQIGEDEDLEQEYGILQSAQELKEYCQTANSKLNTDDYAAVLLLNQAVRALERAAAIDPTLKTQVESIETVSVEIDEVSRALNVYIDRIDDSTERLQQVEERLTLLNQLKRKYGSTSEKILQFLADAKNRLEYNESIDEQRDSLEREIGEILDQVGCLAEKLSIARAKAADDLSEIVNSELAEMGMPMASFHINLVREESEDGAIAYKRKYSFTQKGIDRVQFLVSTNPGEQLRPLADVVSGGETCRLMLALKSALRQADVIPTLLFDEIDSGVGGRNANVVGKKLASLAVNRQVICITHLPQIACFGDNHYRVIKDIGLEQSITSVVHLKGSHRIQELAAMLGGTKKPMLESAQELLVSARN